ncbi:MAG: CHASE2 domain-containing protein, partial [Oleiharenicola lentus]
MAENAHTDSPLRWRWLLPVALLVVAFHFTPFDATLNRAFFDASSRHPFREPPLPQNSALVLVDEQTMTAMSAQGVRWPFPRIVFAQLLAALQQAGAEKIVVDFTFFEESDAAQDQLLGGVAAGSPAVILASTAEHPPVFWGDEFVRTHPQFFPAARTGYAGFAGDSDGIGRRYIPTGSLAGFGSFHDEPGGLLRWHGGLEQIKAKGVLVLSAAPFIAAGRPIVDRLAEAAPDLDANSLAGALRKEPALTGASADAV